MNTTIKNVRNLTGQMGEKCDVILESGKVYLAFEDTPPIGSAFFNGKDLTVLPGFVDVHVHFREPGFSYKETVKTGCLSAARGGYSAVCPMPNLNPVPDSGEHLEQELEKIREGAILGVYPYGSLTVNEMGEEMAALSEMKDSVVAFSDDGRGVQEESMMRSLMEEVKKLGKIAVAHCEVNSLLRGGYIHDGEYAKRHGHRGICSASEYLQIERDCRLSKETGCPYHVCHISTKESVEIIRKAKREGVNVTCETAPHYLLLDENDLEEDGRFKMNPPLRGREDREALLRGIQDGTIDMVATDHAPHTPEEKSRGLEKSPFGVVGLETAFPSLYTGLVKEGIIPLEKLLDLMVWNPAKRFSLPLNPLENFALWNLNEQEKVNPEKFLTMGRSTPFQGKTFFGVNHLTAYQNKIIYRKSEE